MKHVFWLDPERLAGRSGPDKDPWVLEELRGAGIGAVLNVSEFEPAWSDFKAAGLDVTWLPLPNHYPATPETEETCIQLVPQAYDIVMGHLKAKRAVMIHCAWGRDRTGLILAYHLMQKEKLSPRDAISRLRQIRPEAITAPGWEAMALNVFERLQVRDSTNETDPLNQGAT